MERADHESLDLDGFRINVTAPIDMQAAEPSKTVYATRRVIRNGQLQAVDGPAWDPTVVTSTATYAASNAKTLTNVANVGSIAVGSLVTGSGVGREVYVTSRNIGAGTLTLSQQLYDAEGTQNFTFTRFKYILDFSGYENLSQFVIDDIEFQCQGHASAVLLAPDGLTFHLRDCFVTRPRDRGLTSPGRGCQGMMIDRCQFISNEQSAAVNDRTTIGFNANANDVKIRDNRTALFKHFAILAGTGNLLTGNHWFHGDTQTNGVRKGGIIITTPNCKTAITGNYIDNNFIEWTNEHDATPALGAQFSFGGLTLSGNIFTTNDVADWFKWIIIKPYGAGHFIHGFTVTGNVFRSINGFIDRVEGVDTTFADLDFNRMRNVIFQGNSFHGVTTDTFNPLSRSHVQSSAAGTWTVDPGDQLPFRGWARTIESVCPKNRITNASGGTLYDLPWAQPNQGSDKRRFNLNWPTAAKGEVRYVVRMDNPL